MSLYKPNPIYLRVVAQSDGYWIYDQFGPFEGPYESSADAWAVIREEEAAYHRWP